MPVSFEKARSLVLDNMVPAAIEEVPLLEAQGRALAEDFVAPWDLPLFDNSAMDGYAVRHEDCRSPAALPIAGYIPAGGRADRGLQSGTAVKIMTGAPVPPGCDTVIPFEETAEWKGTVSINRRPTKGAHIRYRGEDVPAGSRVLAAGTCLGPAEISLLASFGQSTVPVRRRPVVAILSTGDELVEPGEAPGPWQIVDSNSVALAAAVHELGAVAKPIGIARDTAESLREKLAEGLQADVLITSAGVSMGDRDFVREVLEELGVKQLFWKVDIKPGRPTAFGLKDGKPVFAVPGNPVSALITFEQFVRPALLKMMGHRQPIKPTVKARLLEPVKKKKGRIFFMRVAVHAVDDGLAVTSSGDQNTGIQNTLVHAGGIAILPADRESLVSGDLVDVQLLGNSSGIVAQPQDMNARKKGGHFPFR